MNNILRECSICHCQDYQVKQLCCSPGLSCCITCIINSRVTPQTQCPRCKRQVGKRLKKILTEAMDHTNIVNINQQARRSQNKQSMMSSSMILTHKKQQLFRNQQEQKMGNYQNYSPLQNFAPQNFSYHPLYQIPYYQQNFQGWQPNNYYGNMGHHIPHPMMMHYQYPQFPQRKWNKYQERFNQPEVMDSSYPPPSYYTQEDLEQIVTQKMLKSGKRGLGQVLSRSQNYQDEPQEMPRHLYHGQAQSRAYQHESKTTDIMESTTQNKVIKLNRSNSVNHLTLRR